MWPQWPAAAGPEGGQRGERRAFVQFGDWNLSLSVNTLFANDMDLILSNLAPSRLRPGRV